VTDYEYDLWGRTTLVTYPKPLTSDTERPYVEYDYDRLSRLVGMTENVTASTTRSFAYAYDALGRLTLETLPDPSDGTISGNSPAYATFYDVLGNVLEERDARGNPTRYAYDDLYRLRQVTLSDPDGPGTAETNAPAPITVYRYDDASQLVRVDEALYSYHTPGGAPQYYFA
jgi:YD repeat-containing protein